MASGTDNIVERRRALLHAMERVSSGDRDALQDVYQRTSAKLLGVILRIVPDREQAEDVLQEVYFKVWRRAGRYDPEKGSPISWLATIARNSAIDEVRRSGRIETAGNSGIAEIADSSAPADEMLCQSEEHEAVRRCMETLEQNQRKSIRLAFFGGFSHSQLAEHVGVPLGTMKSWIRRGLVSLKGCLGHDRP